MDTSLTSRISAGNRICQIRAEISDGYWYPAVVAPISPPYLLDTVSLTVTTRW